MKNLLIIVALLTISLNLRAADTVGYTKISDIKAFSNYLSIYLEGGQQHTCDSSNNTRFQSDTANAHYTSFLLTAFTSGKGVNFKYSCDGTTAVITGIRLQAGS